MIIIFLHLRISCEQCILQWTYTAGNNWGVSANGTGDLGCGPQVWNRGGILETIGNIFRKHSELVVTSGSSHLVTSSILATQK